MLWADNLCIFLHNRSLFSKLLRIEMFNMIKMFALHIGVTFIAPIWKICERQSDRMLAFLVVLAHVRVHISAASYLHTFQANPVLSFVITVFTGIWNLDFREFLYWSDMLIRNTMWAFFYRLDGKESHYGADFVFLIFGSIYFFFFLFVNL